MGGADSRSPECTDAGPPEGSARMLERKPSVGHNCYQENPSGTSNFRSLSIFPPAPHVHELNASSTAPHESLFLFGPVRFRRRNEEWDLKARLQEDE
jgi:hypothetical protein